MAAGLLDNATHVLPGTKGRGGRCMAWKMNLQGYLIKVDGPLVSCIFGRGPYVLSGAENVRNSGSCCSYDLSSFTRKYAITFAELF